MPSQKSRPDAQALPPTRERGRQRVSTILDAGALVFAERGFEAATMTEIAARAATAIGSLYRFFPTKDALAEALLQRYVADFGGALDAIAAAARELPADEIADRLFDLMLDGRRDRAAAAALMDVRGDAAHRRSALRERVRHGLAAILIAGGPIDRADAAILATVLLQMLKGIRVMAEEWDRPEAKLAALRAAVRLYVGHGLGRRDLDTRDHQPE